MSSRIFFSHQFFVFDHRFVTVKKRMKCDDEQIKRRKKKNIHIYFIKWWNGVKGSTVIYKVKMRYIDRFLNRKKRIFEEGKKKSVTE